VKRTTGAITAPTLTSKTWHPPAERSNWFHLASVDLGNGPLPGGAGGDFVGVSTQWEWPDPTAGLTGADFDKAAAEIRRGKIPTQPTGEYRRMTQITAQICAKKKRGRPPSPALSAGNVRISWHGAAERSSGGPLRMIRGPMWIAIPSSQGTCTLYSSRSPGASHLFGVAPMCGRLRVGRTRRTLVTSRRPTLQTATFLSATVLRLWG
jgi:hypothetical protein